MPILANAKHERFAQELANGKSPPEAYVIAGYSPNEGNASRLKGNEKVRRRLTELLDDRNKIAVKATEKAVERSAITKETILSKLWENAQRASQAIPVTNGDGEKIGIYKYDGAVVNRACELLGKELGMFIDRTDIRVHAKYENVPLPKLVEHLSSLTKQLADQSDEEE